VTTSQRQAQEKDMHNDNVQQLSVEHLVQGEEIVEYMRVQNFGFEPSCNRQL
jgi:hypothetical protein